jgi:hypothetical protein
MNKIIGLAIALAPPAAFAQALTCTWNAGSGSCMNVTVKNLFAGLGEGYALRFDAATISGTAQCDLGSLGGGTRQVEWAITDSWYREKFSLLTSAELSGRKTWFEFVPKTPGNAASKCILTYVGLQ